MDQPLHVTTKKRAMRSEARVNSDFAAPIETAYWITGPDADPLRSTPWLSSPLPRPRYFTPITAGRRIRSLFILLCVLALVVGVVVLAVELDHTMFGTPLPTLPRLPLP
ncbi:MAG TPA: hypothetical protein VIG30_14985 [Ktedonobacterales bacterium]